jgi:hypothetical protein
VAATIPESAKLAGAVILGIVENEKDPNAFMDNDIYLTNALYYKGCGPSRVRVKGYSQSSMCGIDAPKSGDKVMVFVCKDDDGWRLNTYVAYAGQSKLNDENLKILIDTIGDVNQCSNEAFVFKKCGKRKPGDVKKKDLNLAPTPVLIEPPMIPPPSRPSKPISVSSNNSPYQIPNTKPSKPILVQSNNSPYQLPKNFYRSNINRRNVKVSSRINPMDQNLNTVFPNYTKPTQVVLNKGNPLVSESSGKVSNDFQSFFSSFLNNKSG